MKAFILLLALHLTFVLQAQSLLRLSDPAGQPVLDIREGQRFLCGYQLPNQPERLARGRLMAITDSAITYRVSYDKAQQVIPLSAIRTIYRIRFGKYWIPAIVAGVVAGSLDVVINRRNSALISGLFLSGGVVGAIHYISAADRRRLAKNQVGKTVYLSVIPAQ